MRVIEEEGQLPLVFNDEPRTFHLISSMVERCPRCGCAADLRRIKHGLIILLRSECSNPACDYPPTEWVNRSDSAIRTWNIAAILQK